MKLKILTLKSMNQGPLIYQKLQQSSRRVEPGSQISLRQVSPTLRICDSRVELSWAVEPGLKLQQRKVRHRLLTHITMTPLVPWLGYLTSQGLMISVGPLNVGHLVSVSKCAPGGLLSH